MEAKGMHFVSKYFIHIYAVQYDNLNITYNNQIKATSISFSLNTLCVRCV